MLATKGTLSLAIPVLALCGIAFESGHGFQNQQKSKVKTQNVKTLPLNESLPPNIPPASCQEWKALSAPPVLWAWGDKCKVLGGAHLCWRAGSPDNPPSNPALQGVLDIGPISGQTKVNQPITVYFRLRNFGSGDETVYVFGKLDWGDNAQQNILPWSPSGVPATHRYTSQKTFVIHAMAGAQFTYSTPQVGGVSGSYEACQDNSIKVTVTP